MKPVSHRDGMKEDPAVSYQPLLDGMLLKADS
jgi:hypothetical protein